MLVEAETLCGGVTRNTIVKITSQHRPIYDRLIHTFDLDRARQCLRENESALQKYRELYRGMEWDFGENGAHVYSLDDCGKIERELPAPKKLGFRGGIL